MYEVDKIYYYKGYKTKFEYSEEDGLFFGQLLDIRDLVLFHGKSLLEAYQDFIFMVDDYLRFKKKIEEELSEKNSI